MALVNAFGEIALDSTVNSVKTATEAINTKTPQLVGGRVPVDGSAVTQPISAASLPLPSGAATQATLVDILTALGATLVFKQAASTATLSNVTTSTTNTTLLAFNSNRKGATVFNDSAAILYVKFGATASATSYTVKVPPLGYYEVPFGYTGIIDGMLSFEASNPVARMTEIE